MSIARFTPTSRLQEAANEITVFLGLLVTVVTCLVFAVLDFHFSFGGGFFPFLIGSAFIVLIGAKPTRTELLATVGLALAFWLTLFIIRPPERTLSQDVFTFLGIISAIILWMRSVTDPNYLPAFWSAMFFVGGCFAFALIVGGAGIRDTWDWNLYAFDLSLGILPGYQLGRLIANSPILHEATSLAYEILWPAMAMVQAGQIWNGRDSVKIVPVATSALVIGFFLYLVLPGAGPLYAFPDSFPWHPPILPKVTAPASFSPHTPRNAMPSLHLTLAFLIAWHSREFGRQWRFLASAFVLVTVFTTLALGEHYFVDLVVAVPFALAIQAAWTTCQGRSLALVTGIGLTAGWLMLLRYGVRAMLASPVIPWTLVAFTIGACGYLALQLMDPRGIGSTAPIPVGVNEGL